MDPIEHEADVGGVLRRYGWWIVGAGVLLALAVLVGLCDAGQIELGGLTGAGSAENAEVVSRGEFGADWPFTVSSGTLRCRDGAVTFTTGDATYAVNERARSRGAGEVLTPIWRDSPKGYRKKMKVEPIVERGENLCD